MAQRLDMLVDLVDSSDRVIGTAKRRQVLKRNVGFRVAHAFVFNRAGDLLVQQIAPGLRHAGQWGSSVAGYLQAGETYRQAAERKLRQELGIAPVVAAHGKTSMADQSALKFIELFTGLHDGPFSPNAIDAIAEAKKHVELKQAMDQVLAESKALAARSVATVQALITKLKLAP